MGVVTFPLLGRKGRLGNQLFQIAATIGIAERNGLVWDLPTNVENCSAGVLLGLKSRGLIPSTGVVDHEERSQLYYDVELEPNQTHRVFAITGYFQSMRYFEKSLDSLRPVFQIPEHMLRIVKASIKEVDLENSIGVHVRRGDYVSLSHLYRLLDYDYYISAISAVKNRSPAVGQIVIVSDDVQWCKDKLLSKLQDIEVVFSPFKNDQLFDFVLLYLTKHNIIANSSFSWWAAFLKRLRATSPIGTVVAPRLRYNTQGSLSYLNLNRMYPDDWILV